MRSTIPIAAAAAILAAAPAAAQDGRAYVNPYLGYYAFDESSFEEAFDRADIEDSPIVGARLGWSSGTWGIEAAYGRSSFEAETLADDILSREETTIHLLYAALSWSFPLGPVEPFVSGGAGAIDYSPDRRDGSTHVLVNFGGGLKVAVGDRLRIRVDAKDHVDLCDGPDASAGESDTGACFEDETDRLHNIELSGGVEIGL